MKQETKTQLVLVVGIFHHWCGSFVKTELLRKPKGGLFMFQKVCEDEQQALDAEEKPPNRYNQICQQVNLRNAKVRRSVTEGIVLCGQAPETEERCFVWSNIRCDARCSTLRLRADFTQATFPPYHFHRLCMPTFDQTGTTLPALLST
jgi:hypothetical protein